MLNTPQKPWFSRGFAYIWDHHSMGVFNIMGMGRIIYAVYIYTFIGNEWFPSPTISHDFPIGDGTMPILADFQPEGWDEDAESCSICHALLGRRRETRCFFVGGKPWAVHLVYTCLHHAFFTRKIGICTTQPKGLQCVCIYICI